MEADVEPTFFCHEPVLPRNGARGPGSCAISRTSDHAGHHELPCHAVMPSSWNSFTGKLSLFRKVQKYTPAHDPAGGLPGTCSKELKTYVQTKPYTQMLAAALFMIVRIGGD